jgi:molecular chaperone DnaK (HSP70)
VIADCHATLLEKKIMPFSRKYPKDTAIKVVFTIDREGVLHVHSEMPDEQPLDFELQITGVRNAEELAKTTKKINDYKCL